jgi:hypothetical protein
MSNILEQASLVLIPSGYKSGKIYSQIPIDGDGDLQFTRASDATRVNSAGLIEKVRTNLVTYSEDFSNAAWTKVVTTFSGDTLTADAGVALKFISQSQTTQGLQNIYFDVQYVNHQFLQILIGSSGADLQFANFDIQNKVLGSTGGGVINRKIEDFGTFVRISMSLSPLNKVTAVLAFIDSGTAARAALSSSTGSFKLFRSQNQTGDIATDYIPTTTAAVSVGMTADVPRLDYLGSSCPSLLLEPQRTNLALFSEQFSLSPWANRNSPIITANNAIAPDGTMSADSFNVSDGSLSGRNQVVVLGAGTYTFSCYLKRNASSVVGGIMRLRVIADGSTNQQVFTLTNDWVRYSFTFTAAVGVTLVEVLNFNINHFDAWGAQLELGAYATSYIPTLGTSVTRVADAFIRDNIYTNGLITSSGGTWFVELRNNIVYSSPGFLRFGVGDTSALSTNSLFIRTTSTSRIIISKIIGGSGTTLYNTLTDTVKIAIKWNGTSADVFINGIKEVSATAFTTTDMEFLKGEVNSPMFIQSMALYPSPLTDAQCIQLTTL